MIEAQPQKKMFILGNADSIEDSAFSSSDQIFQRVGHNTGNLAFHYAVTQFLGVRPKTVPWHASASDIDAAGQIGIMPCANQLGTHVDMGGFASKLEGTGASLLAVGLGAQGSSLYTSLEELPKGTVAWLNEIAKRAPSADSPNITVRGDFTLNVLQKYGFGDRAVSLGCPSLLINPDKSLGEKLQGAYKKTISRVAVAAGHPAWAPLSVVESSLVRIMEDTDDAYIVQATGEALALARNDRSIGGIETYKQTLRTYLKLNLDDSQFERWIRRYMVAFYNVPAWMEYLKGFDFVVGSRIHGIMLAIQAGVPGLCIAHDSRIRELCEKSRIPYLLASDLPPRFTLMDLLARIEFDGSEFDRNRAAIKEAYKAFFFANGVNTTL
ncbi:polysaccharide pyruvyl transferase family protein [Agrobacterium pusense]|uniref:Polysaccharide pyruvyl transferase family protein n=1 Tax=Agrobacterium pusense TaxID=648995 RepID=A0AA44IXH1_9HYPH|nr:polysaccharide pyruvyl transferase family protein [Agrobacterium pusense]NRF07620.1 polysaccharide pyruvyl transferase family protein [Agrobacterium pusense]NRF18352.1 polysaccharide pyruvyl transferase family protein [Agrobacterium pusense]